MSEVPPTSQPQRRRPQPDGVRARSGHAAFRTDVEGLRAIAVLLVLIYHAGVSGLPGGFVGVDIFFVVSGFVITTQLLREVESTGRVSLIGFYGRRAKRLLPAAGLVLLVTSIAAWLLASPVEWRVIGTDIVAAAAYVVNWSFAARSVDYLAEDVGPSPVLHFWSLAVEEQFYVIWPLVILGLVWFLGRRMQRGPAAHDRTTTGAPAPQRRQLAAGLLVLIVVPSLVFSIGYTWWRPEQAFFVTPTRLWELGAGALVALWATGLRTWRPRTGALVAWVGLLAVLASALLMSAATPWPGAAALVPVVGTALVIAGGFSSPGAGPARLLGLRPLVWIGGLSYSLYLWHWPLLRFWEWQFGPPSLAEGLAVVAASVLPAWLSYRFVESPIRHAPLLNSSPRYALSLGLNFSAASVIAGLVLMQGAVIGTATGTPTGATWADGSNHARQDPAGRDQPAGRDEPAGPGDPADPGATADQSSRTLAPPTAEDGDRPPFFDTVTPSPLAATSDVPLAGRDDCTTDLVDTEVVVCDFGDPDGEVLVAVVGDSKASQWMPALEAIAADRGWLLRLYSKSGCPFTAALTEVDGVPDTGCQEWSRAVMERLSDAERPEVMITSSIRAKALDDAGDTSREALVAGYVDRWSQLREQGTRVVALSDTPQPMDDDVTTPYACAAEHPDDIADRCTWPSDDGIGSAQLRAAAEQVDGAAYLDMNPWVCPGQTCAAVYRNVLTYRQGSHITATFAAVLTEPLAAQLVPLVEGSPER